RGTRRRSLAFRRRAARGPGGGRVLGDALPLPVVRPGRTLPGHLPAPGRHPGQAAALLSGSGGGRRCACAPGATTVTRRRSRRRARRRGGSSRPGHGFRSPAVGWLVGPDATSGCGLVIELVALRLAREAPQRNRPCRALASWGSTARRRVPGRGPERLLEVVAARARR